MRCPVGAHLRRRGAQQRAGDRIAVRRDDERRLFEHRAQQLAQQERGRARASSALARMLRAPQRTPRAARGGAAKRRQGAALGPTQRARRGAPLLQRREPLAAGLRGFGLRIGLAAARRSSGAPPCVSFSSTWQLAIASSASGARGLSGALATSAAEDRDRLLVVALAVLRIAEPEQRRLAVAARAASASGSPRSAARAAVEVAAARKPASASS